MTLSERIDYFDDLFVELKSTSSRNAKLNLIKQIPTDLKDDFDFILECLDGKHPFNYKLSTVYYTCKADHDKLQDKTIKEVLEMLLRPTKDKDTSIYNISKYTSNLSAYYYYFFEPIVDRTLKLGIGRSLLPLSAISPMLAKKYDDNIWRKISGKTDLYITEKLDGNRCIAYHDGFDWNFMSRNGKPMYVKFDMTNLPTNFIYDGEVMTRKQTKDSINRFDLQKTNSTQDFIEASGTINRHTTDKDVVYNIFDIIGEHLPYTARRAILHNLTDVSNDIRILPVLAITNKETIDDVAGKLLYDITSHGGEGIMINVADATYQHKRTSDLIKYKNMYTIDMKVIDILQGTGKYVDGVGAIVCEAVDNNKIITCKIGTGISDEQRWLWWDEPYEILNKIVEVGYFSLSQEAVLQGTNRYSLRFPRLIKVRDDKNTVNLEV